LIGHSIDSAIRAPLPFEGRGVDSSTSSLWKLELMEVFSSSIRIEHNT
jgi:hypothetical protein